MSFVCEDLLDIMSYKRIRDPLVPWAVLYYFILLAVFILVVGSRTSGGIFPQRQS